MYWELLSFYKLFPCTEDFVNVYEFPPVLGTLNFYDFPPALKTLSFYDFPPVLETWIFIRFIFPCTQDLQIFLLVLELRIFTDFLMH